MGKIDIDICPDENNPSASISERRGWRLYEDDVI